MYFIVVLFFYCNIGYVSIHADTARDIPLLQIHLCDIPWRPRSEQHERLDPSIRTWIRAWASLDLIHREVNVPIRGNAECVYPSQPGVSGENADRTVRRVEHLDIAFDEV